MKCEYENGNVTSHPLGSASLCRRSTCRTYTVSPFRLRGGGRVGACTCRRARVAGFALVFLALLAVCGPRHSDAAIRTLRRSVSGSLNPLRVSRQLAARTGDARRGRQPGGGVPRTGDRAATLRPALGRAPQRTPEVPAHTQNGDILRFTPISSLPAASGPPETATDPGCAAAGRPAVR